MPPAEVATLANPGTAAGQNLHTSLLLQGNLLMSPESQQAEVLLASGAVAEALATSMLGCDDGLNLGPKNSTQASSKKSLANGGL